MPQALTLDAQGNPDSVFVFQIGSTLTTASNASVRVINGAQSCNAFWQVGSSATLGTATALVGSVLALTSITLGTSAAIVGRALARNGAVTMDNNRVAPLNCAAASDSGVVDSGVVDSGVVDSGVVDSGVVDSGLSCCPGSVACGATCVDLESNGANCGACGRACATGQTCTSGACQACAAVCSGECTDLRSDSYNCGACGNACPSGRECTDGACVRCPTLCNGNCADLVTSGSDCGACGHACATDQECVASVCRAVVIADCLMP